MLYIILKTKRVFHFFDKVKIKMLLPLSHIIPNAEHTCGNSKAGDIMYLILMPNNLMYLEYNDVICLGDGKYSYKLREGKDFEFVN